jgi:ornithine carbamoyltransferase
MNPMPGSSPARRPAARARFTATPPKPRGADVVVTDTWISMGQAHAEAKLQAMAPYQVNDALMAQAKADALFLHCLPAHRGEEVTDLVIDGARRWYGMRRKTASMPRNRCCAGFSARSEGNGEHG